ncbi:sulfatase [Flavivirga abyssicola]|uniref:sulfatase n=1 Tax=Flavivirga abyssicola TaxID=3063533 RepID=UPI0026E0D349|nr:sulfatase [Flavivirga sp. MEBiC07777]WVK13770.1 sulfatase [Flavivirga sp. MEBiC07777]
MKYRIISPLRINQIKYRFKINLTYFALLFSVSFFAQQEKPNVLFIAIDDINDWVAPLGGNKQAITPNMDRFVDNGAVIFKNNVCAAPVCGPSRSAILSGFYPSTSGIYNNGQNLIYSDVVKANATLPEYFSKNGYHTMANGKIFHKHATANGVDFGAWAFDEFARARRYNKDAAKKKFYTASKAGVIHGEHNPGFIDKKSKLSWGPTKDAFEETVDYKVADWARTQLSKDFDKPFFMAVGFIKPHLPWFVPQEYFDMYDVDAIEDIITKEDDLEDIVKPNGKPLFKPTGEYNWIRKHNLGKEATRAYLANISYVDACLGIVMDALEKSGHADDTIVVLWGDHGWHLGEKLRYLKSTLWLEVVKTPLFVKLPEMDQAVYCEKTVSLLDLYPTLVNLCNLPKKANIEGHDFSALLKNVDSDWERPGITVSNEGTSVLTEKWHYINYVSGAEEFYDVTNDSMEWNNLIHESEYRQEIKKLKKWIPKKRVAPKKERYKKPSNYVDADQDTTIKKTRDFNKLE